MVPWSGDGKGQAKERHTEKPGEGIIACGAERAGWTISWKRKGREDRLVGRMRDEGREEARE